MQPLTNQPIFQGDGLALKVFQGRCGSLVPTSRVVNVPFEFVDEPYDEYALQETKYPGVYWFLRQGQRYNNYCFCAFCKTRLNGSGSNMKVHSVGHSDFRTYSQDQKNAAALLFMLRHSIGFSVFRDPLVRIFLPQLSPSVVEQLFIRAKNGVRDLIRREIASKEVTVMIDGWCDASMRRYLGVAVAYHSKSENRMIHRFLDLGSGIVGQHTAAHCADFLRKCLESFGMSIAHVKCICSDSAATNPAIAEKLSVNWMPCCVHLWNLVVQNFVRNSPKELTEVLTRINQLRNKTLWIEFVARAQHGQRNIAGYCPTRWCSVCMCLNSFLSFKDLIMEFQETNMKTDPLFTEKDFEVIGHVNQLFERFAEANDLLSKADQMEGLATVFEVISTVYQIICEDCKKEWEFTVAVRRAKSEVEARFFNERSKFCCRLMLAGILDVRHRIPRWLEDRSCRLLSLLAEEIELQQSTSGRSGDHANDRRYTDDRPLTEIIYDSPVSWDETDLADEIAHFYKTRTRHHGSGFLAYWSEGTEYRQIQSYAIALRSFPTTTIWLERAFSIARRNLTWTRLHLTGDRASDICFLAINSKQVEVALGLGAMTDVISDEIITDLTDTLDGGDDYTLDEEE